MYAENENKIISAQDLFGKYRLIKQGGNPINERAALIGYFTDFDFTGKNGKSLDAQVIGVHLAHFSLDQLYALQAGFKDRIKTHGTVTARKWWWYASRTKKL